MKKHFLFTLSFILFSCATILAQTEKKKTTLSFGGNGSGSVVSIMQLIDYPVLLLADANEKVLSYEFKIVTEEAQSSKTIKVEGPKLDQEALAYLRNLAGENGQVSIQNVKTQKGETIFETPYRIDLKFNQ